MRSSRGPMWSSTLHSLGAGHSKKFFSSRSICWPDPDPAMPKRSASNEVPPLTWRGNIFADDISGVQATNVAGIVYPRTAEEVATFVRSCIDQGTKISMRGTQHSMGGHSIAPSGLVLDLKEMKHIAFHTTDESEAIEAWRASSKNAGGMRLVDVGPGVTWAELIAFLNPFGLSPRTMQSYSSFSIGGTLSVNGHGVTTDYTVAESVAAFDLVLHDGSTHRCSRHAEKAEDRELFQLVLGGYGMFGVMTSITLVVGKNIPIVAETFPVSSADFPFVYEGLLHCPVPDEIAVKLVRLDVTNPDAMMVYLFRSRVDPGGAEGGGGVQGVVGNLSAVTREMSPLKRLLYKWLMTPLKEFRFKVEAQRGSAIDWVETHDKNALMFETAAPLARISDPLFTMDDTFILQEFFVPFKKYAAFMAEVKPIYAEAAAQDDAPPATTAAASAGGSCRVHLLNTTIRFVQRDTDTFLPYATCEGGMLAFVLYYRIHRTEASLAKLRYFHNKFAEAALACGGTFFLPYLHHYSAAQLERGYPTIRSFAAKKEQYDPHGRFDSLWFREYCLPLTSAAYRKLYEALPSNTRPCNKQEVVIGQSDEQGGMTIPVVSERRSDSFKKLMASYPLRSKFQHVFLEHVFNVAPSNSALVGAMSRIFWDARIGNDLEAYEALQKWLADDVMGDAVSSIQLEVNKVLQVARQKSELATETLRLVAHLGRVGELNGYASIGDNGKMALPLRRALRLRGPTYIVHNENPDEHSVPAAVERGSTRPVGTFCRINYDLCVFPEVPDAAVDLVTMNQGLHHLPQEALPTFLREVRRVLRPGGLFITREHDAVPSLVPMLDMAHAVFNALTGVDVASERSEIRAFRPVEEWRKILRSCGLVDSCCYELQQQTDPTLDYMLCFAKPKAPDSISADAADASESKRDEEDQYSTSAEAPPFQATLDEIPQQVLRGGKSFLKLIRSLCDTVSESAQQLSPSGQEAVVKLAVEQAIAPVRTIVSRLEVLSDEARPHASLQLDVFPSEFFHAYVALERRVALGKASPGQVVLVQSLKAVFNGLMGDVDTSGDYDEAPAAAAAYSATDDPSLRLLTQDDIRLEARAAMLGLFAQKPELLLVDTYVRGGFPAPMIDIIRSATSSDDTSRSTSAPSTKEERLADKLGGMIALRCDDVSWRIIRSVLKDHGALAHAPPLTMDSLLNRGGSKHTDESEAASDIEASNCWHRLLLGYLASTKVQISFAARVGARMYGIDDIDGMIDKGKQLRERYLADLELSRRKKEGSQQRCLSSSDEHELEQLSQQLNAAIHTVTMRGADSMRNILGVSEVISAIFQQNKDVTSIVRRSLLRNDTIVLEGVDLDKVFDFGITPLSRFFYGERVLTVTYRTTNPPLAGTAQEVSRSITTKLQSAGIVRVQRCKNPNFNIFRLPEWLQVDMCKAFADSLEHTPWYRFEFLRTMQVYYKVLLQCAGRVRATQGIRAAYLSSPFMLSFVPSLAMGAVFAQLQILSLPVKARLGGSYKPTQLQQQLLIRVRKVEALEEVGSDDDSDELMALRRSNSENVLQDDIRMIFPPCFFLRQTAGQQELPQLPHPRHIVGDFYEARVPVFRAFQGYLQAFARHESPARRQELQTRRLPVFESTILSIDGQQSIQLLVGVLDEAQMDALGRSQICQINFDFQLPTDEVVHPQRGGPDGEMSLKRVSLTAAVPHLLKLLQFCDEWKIQVLHVFDIRS